MKAMKKHVSIVGLLERVRRVFLKIPDVAQQAQIPLIDCLMSGLAVFLFKSPSLLQFDKDRQTEPVKHNLRTLFGVENAPCDTSMRERLDVVAPHFLRRAYTRIFSTLQRSKALESFAYYQDHYLLLLDGTGVFSSPDVHCEDCCVKEHQDGSKTYYHQMLGAVIAHPSHKEVIPLCPEPILKQDGHTKNDCERNAAKRLLEDTHREHPHLKVIVVEDGLASNAPHVRLLKELKYRFILGAKPDDHKSLFEFVKSVWVERDEWEEQDADGTHHRYRWVNQVPLNDSNLDVVVNFLEYWEISPKGKKQHFTWVTDIPLHPSTVRLVMKGGRCRWRIENETFNTLKNNGYQFEHNFGHGHQHLSTVFPLLMFLAFLIDQCQQLCCAFFKAALKKMGRKLYLWNEMRILVKKFLLSSWEEFYQAISQGYKASLVIDTS
jgi:hypothetical protein